MKPENQQANWCKNPKRLVSVGRETGYSVKEKSKLLRNKFSKYRYFLIGFVLSASVLWPLFQAPFFSHHDDVSVIRLHQMHQCVVDGQIPCRWVPDLGGGFGYPLFNYYPPLPYYLGEVFYLMTGKLLLSVKLLFGLSILFSFGAMYLLGTKLWGKLGGLLAGVFYVFAPYHAADLYVRGAMGELWAFVFVPLLFWSVIIALENKSLWNKVALALVVAMLIMSHNISAVLFLPAAFAFGVVLGRKDLKMSVITLLVFNLAGVALAAFYWLPAVMEKGLVHVELLTSGYFHYSSHFKGLTKMFLEQGWDWGPSVREVPGGATDARWYQVGLLHWVGALIAMFIAWRATDERKRENLSKVVFYFLLFILGVFMVHPGSQFVWDAIPLLGYFQFPWRFLLLVSFALSVVVGYLGKRKQHVLASVLLLAVVAANFGKFVPERFFNTSDYEYLHGETYRTQMERSFFDYLPKYSALPPAEYKNWEYLLTDDEAKVTSFRKGTDWIRLQTSNPAKTTITVAQYYFPNWRAFVNGEEVAINYAQEPALMEVDLPAGENNIEFKLENTPIRSAANIISLVTLVLIFLGFSRKKVHATFSL